MKPLSFKNLLFITLILVIGTQSELYAQKLTTAISYLDFMNGEHRKIGEDVWSYTNAVAHGKNARKVEVKRKDLIKTTLSAKNNIAKMPDFEGDASLRDSMVAYLNMSYLVLNDDYSKIVDLEAIAEQSYDLMETYMTAQEKANEKMEIAGKMVESQTRIFAGNHKINLIEGQDKLGRKLEIASAVFKYYNKIYLLFFKSYKQEAYFLSALEKNDVNGLEQNKSALLKIAEESIKTNDTIKNYKNDPSLKIACRQLLDFYKQEASIKAPILIDFYLKKYNFEKTKAAYDAKMDMARTKEDVASINKAIAEFNKANAQYNSINQELFNRRSVLTNAWNNAVQSFFDRQIPKN